MLNMVPNLRCQPKKELDFYLKSIAPSHSVIPLQSYDFLLVINSLNLSAFGV